MKHEMDNATLVQAAERFGCHPKELDIVRQKVASCRKKQREPAAENQDHSNQPEQRAAVADECSDKVSVVHGIHGRKLAVFRKAEQAKYRPRKGETNRKAPSLPYTSPWQSGLEEARLAAF